MKFKDLVTVAYNKANNQVNLSIRKSKLKKFDVDIEELLDMKINREIFK